MNHLIDEEIIPSQQKKYVKKPKPNKKFRVIPLGGLDKIGMNITAFEYEDTIIIVDCGIAFPDESIHPGVEAIIPDISYLIENSLKVKGMVITHGHEDHIGAIPYILKNLNVPIYGTPLTIGLISHKLKENNLMDMAILNTIDFGEVVDFKDIKVEFIKTNHSIVDAAALAITTKLGTIIHTGDFKVDYTPVYDDAIDLPRFAQLGEKGVLAILCDSTNAEKPGFTPSEKKVGPAIDSIFAKNTNSRIIVATFASNVDRVQQIINSASKYNRKVLLEGRSMINIVDVASQLGKIVLPEKTLIQENEMKNFKDSEICIICTGSQGETMAALSRMATKKHRKVDITSNDVVVFSSHPIPGNEKSVSYIINNLEMLGAEVIFQDVHVSGHACQEEIKLIFALTQPQYVVPIHGEFKHRLGCSKVAMEVGIQKENIFILQIGNVLEFYSDNSAKINGDVQHGSIMIDAYSKEPINELVVKDRTRLAETGFVNIIFVIDRDSGMYLNSTEVMTRGFVRVSDSKDILNNIKNKSIDILASYSNNGLFDKQIPINNIQTRISDYIYSVYKKKPMVIVSVMRANY